jgi:hypothetical protein
VDFSSKSVEKLELISSPQPEINVQLIGKIHPDLPTFARPVQKRILLEKINKNAWRTTQNLVGNFQNSDNNYG